MKAVAKVNTDGLYLEDELVDDAFSGVVPFYSQPDEQDEPTTPELVGYTVGVSITTPGLYKPRFDLAAWQTYQSTVYEAHEAYIAALDDWQDKGRVAEDKPVYAPPKQPDNLWIEGLVPEEIDKLIQPARDPSELDQLKVKMDEMKAENAALKKSDLENKEAISGLVQLVMLQDVK